MILSPLELIGRIAALVPPPRQHRHRDYGNRRRRGQRTTRLPPAIRRSPPRIASANNRLKHLLTGQFLLHHRPPVVRRTQTES
ncbi:hypothetical protein CKO36_17200 [Rhabdochromatium marinum]|nr:hypothetical protein [Rhabdochromatium marinum]